MNMVAAINFKLISKAAMFFMLTPLKTGALFCKHAVPWSAMLEIFGILMPLTPLFCICAVLQTQTTKTWGRAHISQCARELASGTKAALNTNNVPQKPNFAAHSGMRCRLYARALALAPRDEGYVPCRFRGIFCSAVCTRLSVWFSDPWTLESLLFPSDTQPLRAFRLFPVFLNLSTGVHASRTTFPGCVSTLL